MRNVSDICRELGISHGKNIVSVKNALHQNASAYITAKIRYRMADGSERTLEAGFTRYNVAFTGGKLPDGRKADGVYIVLNDVFMQVINGAMTRPLDYDYLKSLPPAPQRFYELLSYQMYAALKYDRPRAKLTYSKFCAHAPQTRHLDWEKVRSQMNKVHRPHLQSGYIAKVESQPTSDRDDQPDWTFFYQPGPKARAEFRAFAKRGGPSVLEMEPLEPPTLDDTRLTELELELIRRGVTDSIARQLVTAHAEEKIRLQLEILDWRQTRKHGQAIDDPAAYLVTAIKSGENGHAAPKGFVSAAERQRRQEAKQARERQATEEHHLKQLEETRQQAARKKADEHISQLSPEERQALEARLLAEASPETQESYKSPHFSRFRDTLMLGLLREYFEAMLARPESLSVEG